MGSIDNCVEIKIHRYHRCYHNWCCFCYAAVKACQSQIRANFDDCNVMTWISMLFVLLHRCWVTDCYVYCTHISFSLVFHRPVSNERWCLLLDNGKFIISMQMLQISGFLLTECFSLPSICCRCCRSFLLWVLLCMWVFGSLTQIINKLK